MRALRWERRFEYIDAGYHIVGWPYANSEGLNGADREQDV
jgi:hypothetical protein